MPNRNSNSNSNSNSSNKEFISDEWSKRGTTQTRKNTTTLGRPPLHPGKPRGNLTPRKANGRPKNIQKYPNTQVRKQPLGAKVIRFPSAAFLARKKIYSQAEKEAQHFGKKSYEEIMAMEEPEFNAWAASMPKNELLRLARYF